MAVLVEPNSRKASSFFLGFVLVSILWHGLQLLLFTFVFKVENPKVVDTDHGRRLVAQVMVPMKNAVDSNLGVSRSLDVPPTAEAPEFESSFVTMESLSTLVPKVMDASRLKPVSREAPFTKQIQASVPATTPAKVSLASDKKVPYGLSGELKARRVVSRSPLPRYPEWALVAAVELDLEVGLSVDESGIPHQVFIKDGCGDSQTDLLVLQYVEQMRFEPSLGVSRGTILWAFRLGR